MGGGFCSSGIIPRLLLLCFILVVTCSIIPQKGCFLVEAGRDEQWLSSSSCDVYKGSWHYDDSRILYYNASCPFIDPGLNCQNNGRPDNAYLKYRWDPSSSDCQLARIKGHDFLQKFYGTNIMFVGDSLGNNQWQSLACILHSSAPYANYTLVNKGQLVNLTFPEYEMSVMFLKNGFLVDMVVKDVGRVLKLDSLSKTQKWKGADILIFDSYHWWIHTGKYKSWDYYQIGDKLIKDMDPMEAYKTALTSWAKWVDSNLDPNKNVVFFQGISGIHYHGNAWGEPTVESCSGQTKPLDGPEFPGQHYPGEAAIKDVLNGMKTPVQLLDITLLTQLRKDGHPSNYSNGDQDCSHWCLPGVPDIWNEILYRILIDY